MCVSTQHLGGSGGMPPGNFCILDSQIASGTFSGTREWPENLLLFLMHSQVQFSATVPAKIHHNLSNNNHSKTMVIMSVIQVMYVQTYCNPQWHTCINISFIITVAVSVWDFDLNFCLKFKGREFVKGASSTLLPPKWTPEFYICWKKVWQNSSVSH